MKIAPIKEEEIFLKPRLVIYYDVLSDEEIETVKDFASPRVSVNLLILKYLSVKKDIHSSNAHTVHP